MKNQLRRFDLNNKSYFFKLVNWRLWRIAPPLNAVVYHDCNVSYAIQTHFDREDFDCTGVYEIHKRMGIQKMGIK